VAHDPGAAADGSLGLDGATCILTGASSAVGLACARRLAEEGAQLVLVSGHAERLQEAAAEVGGTAVMGDPAAEETAEQAVATAMIRTSKLHALVHCDFLQQRLALDDTDLDEWDALTAVNLRGAFAFARVAQRAMTPYGSGAIVLVTSSTGSVPALPGSEG
jgi:NAD(P)-dependent dehydrogenase (short-subunit alcohol dehydrogenase family)